MRAWLSRTAGPPGALTLEEVPDPVAGPGEVLVRIAACAVNFPDALIIEDRYQVRPPRPFSPGAEASGVVEAIGAGVSNVSPGDRVIAFTSWGAMAEKLAAPAERCFPVPPAMPLDEAAALMMTYGTGLYALRDRAKLEPGETVLVLGAAGGVGLAAVELAKALGAEVVAAASSQAKADAALAAGADRALIYPRGPFDPIGQRGLTDLFKSAAGERGFDIVFDPVGGDYAEAALRAIAWEGRHLVVGFPAGIPRLPLNLVLLKGCQVVGVAWGAVVRADPAAQADNLRALGGLYQAGRIRPRIGERLPFERAPEAIARLSAREAVGKIVLVLDRA